MTLIEPRCCICDTPLDGTDWLCHACADRYGLVDLPFAEWPRWARFLKKFEERERWDMRHQRRYGVETVPVSQNPALGNRFYSDDADEPDNGDMPAFSSDGCAYENIYAEPLLQYKPYKTRAENALYHAVSDVHRKRYGPYMAIGPVCTGEWTLAASRGHR